MILLLDERFRQSGYQALYPREWGKRKECTLESTGAMLREFWEQEKNEWKNETGKGELC